MSNFEKTLSDAEELANDAKELLRPFDLTGHDSDPSLMAQIGAPEDMQQQILSTVVQGASQLVYGDSLSLGGSTLPRKELLSALSLSGHAYYPQILEKLTPEIFTEILKFIGVQVSVGKKKVRLGLIPKGGLLFDVPVSPKSALHLFYPVRRLQFRPPEVKPTTIFNPIVLKEDVQTVYRNGSINTRARDIHYSVKSQPLFTLKPIAF